MLSFTFLKFILSKYKLFYFFQWCVPLRLKAAIQNHNIGMFNNAKCFQKEISQISKQKHFVPFIHIYITIIVHINNKVKFVFFSFNVTIPDS